MNGAVRQAKDRGFVEVETTAVPVQRPIFILLAMLMDGGVDSRHIKEKDLQYCMKLVEKQKKKNG
jgi:hypothetical protein